MLAFEVLYTVHNVHWYSVHSIVYILFMSAYIFTEHGKSYITMAAGAGPDTDHAQDEEDKENMDKFHDQEQYNKQDNFLTRTRNKTRTEI